MKHPYFSVSVFVAAWLSAVPVHAAGRVDSVSGGAFGARGSSRSGFFDSHAGEEAHSVLEPVYEFQQLIPASHLRTDRTAIYPRVKKMSDGRYILFFQGGQIASRIYYCTSPDLKNWSESRLLFEPRAVETLRGPDRRCYSTADAVVLANGDLLVACSFRASAGYKYNLGCGIALKRSRDNGRSWSDETVIYEGTNWEPYLLELPDGRVQCYFTDCHPATRNSGTSVITSMDNGETWHGYRRICRQYKYEDRGVSIFTDQMPCFRLLNDGKTLLGFLEARLEPEGPRGKSIYRMSVVRHEGFDWSPLSAEESGPRDRDTNVVDGCAGYVAVFPSGETLVSCNIDLKFSLKIGDCTGRRFNGCSWAEDWFQPFPRKGFWGSLELLDSHRVIGAMHGDEGIQLGVFYLNHRIDAPCASTMPGGRDWWDNQALFIGGASPAYACFRGCYDEEFFHLFVEYGQCPEDFAIDMMLGSLPLTIDASGLVGTERSAGCRCRQVPEYAGSGSLLRISVPRRLLMVQQGDTLRFNAILRSREIRDTFTFADASDPETWMNIVLR